MSQVAGLYNYWVAIFIMMIGFYGVIAKRNLVKQAIALGLFQTGVFLFYITMAVYRTPDGKDGVAPIWFVVGDGHQKYPGPYDNPLPHVLILTAIVVSVSTLAVALAIIVNIKRRYGTVEEDEILAQEGAQREGPP
jgi:multicomponent Na+:H+ antiporter subunit C